MTDLRFPVDDTIFAVVARILCVQDGRLLVVGGEGLTSKYLPGGAVNVGEEATHAAAREWQEETGLEAGPLRLVGLIENFFDLNGKRGHEVGFYYRLDWAGNFTLTPLADQPDHFFEWLPLDQLSQSQLRPGVIADLLSVPAGEIRHIVQRDCFFGGAKKRG